MAPVEGLRSRPLGSGEADQVPSPVPVHLVRSVPTAHAETAPLASVARLVSAVRFVSAVNVVMVLPLVALVPLVPAVFTIVAPALVVATKTTSVVALAVATGAR